MTRSAINLTLAAVVVVLSQTAALAAQPAVWNVAKSEFKNMVRATPRQNHGRPSSGNGRRRNQSQNNQNRNNSSSTNLPQTSQLDRQFNETAQALNSLAARVSRIEKSVESARKSAQDIESMIRTLARLDDKVSRIKRQLESVSKIPQLRLLRPLVNNLEKVRRQLHKVRVKADQVNRDVVKPLVTRLRNAERKVEAKVAEIRQAASQTQQARQKLTQVSSFVASRDYNRSEVRALESLAKPVRSTIRPVHQMISRVDRSLGGIDREFNSLAQKLNAVSRAKGSVQKLERDLASADKAARDLDKVLSKKISIKFPKKFSISIRQLLEAPGKVLDIVLKPLEKLANKALEPVLRKLKLEIRVPGEINSIPGNLDNLKSMVNNVGASISKVENALQFDIPQKYQSQLSNLLNKSTSQLTR